MVHFPEAQLYGQKISCQGTKSAHWEYTCFDYN
jgi:hypothetical protein